MKVESEQLLSDLVDGEDVDPDALAAALAEPGANELLVEYARLRGVVTGGELPSATFYQNMRTELGRGRRGRRMGRGLAAAAALALCALGGAWLGRWTVPPRPVSAPMIVRGTGEPTPNAVATPQPTAPPTQNCAPAGPPKPDRVVLLSLSADLPPRSPRGNTP